MHQSRRKEGKRGRCAPDKKDEKEGKGGRWLLML